MSRGWAPLPGLLLAALAALAGWVIHLLLPGLPWLTASLLLGVIAGCIPRLRSWLDGALRPGLTLSARRLLRLGIVVLGLKLQLGDIAALGWVTVLAIVALVIVSFGVTWLIGRLFRLEGDQAVLLAAGFSICGVSAVGAMSAARGTEVKDTATPTALVTLYGTLAIVVLPALAPVLGLNGIQFGHWVGASVHDVGQVVATAQTAGAAALAAAIVVKLTRVLMLAPMVAVTSILTRRRGSATGPRPAIVPLFIVGFLVLVLVRSFLPVPAGVLAVADTAQSILLAMALFAIGASLRLEKLVRSGARALAAGLVAWVVILALGLGLVWVADAAGATSDSRSVPSPAPTSTSALGACAPSRAGISVGSGTSTGRADVPIGSYLLSVTTGGEAPAPEFRPIETPAVFSAGTIEKLTALAGDGTTSDQWRTALLTAIRNGSHGDDTTFGQTAEPGESPFELDSSADKGVYVALLLGIKTSYSFSVTCGGNVVNGSATAPSHGTGGSILVACGDGASYSTKAARQAAKYCP